MTLTLSSRRYNSVTLTLSSRRYKNPDELVGAYSSFFAKQDEERYQLRNKLIPQSCSMHENRKNLDP